MYFTVTQWIIDLTTVKVARSILKFKKERKKRKVIIIEKKKK